MTPKRRRPTAPGEILKEDFLAPLGMTPQQLAAKLQWPEKKVEDLLKGKEGINQETAALLAAALGTSPAFWERLEKPYRQWEITRRQNAKGSPKPWKAA
ncbi:MAG: HigA family addiction module antidote protein [Verrucomicrobia bacterium]|nr:HigA family addiction module antidote protein [Verrucomicrobiota bacterium]